MARGRGGDGVGGHPRRARRRPARRRHRGRRRRERAARGQLSRVAAPGRGRRRSARGAVRGVPGSWLWGVIVGEQRRRARGRAPTLDPNRARRAGDPRRPVRPRPARAAAIGHIRAYATAVRDSRTGGGGPAHRGLVGLRPRGQRPERRLAFDGVLTLDTLLGRRWTGLGESARFGQHHRLWTASWCAVIDPAARTSRTAYGVTVLEGQRREQARRTRSRRSRPATSPGRRPLQRLLLVTFTRIATSELSNRVARAARRGRGRVEASPHRHGPNPRRDRSCSCSRPARQPSTPARPPRRALAKTSTQRRSRRPTASCRGTSSAGLASPRRRGRPIVVEDRTTCSVEVVDTLYVRRFHARDTPALRARRDAHARCITTRRRIEPRTRRAPGRGGPARLRGPGRLRPPQQRADIPQYDDLLVRLGAAVQPDGAHRHANCGAAAGSLFVDEFQNGPDPVEVIARVAYGDGRWC